MHENTPQALDLIYVHTHTEALADGVLLDVTKIACETGFRIPVALTCCRVCRRPGYSRRFRRDARPRRTPLGSALHGRPRCQKTKEP